MASSTRKPGEWARDAAWRDVRAWYRRHWTMFPALGGGLVAFVLLNGVLGVPSFISGLYDGVLGAAFLGIILLGGIVGSGSHSRLLGIAGESFTAEEFTRRTRRRQHWHLFNGITINGHEIDHIAIGPGGALAIETKFVGSGRWRVGPAGLEGALRDPLAQARISRDKTSSILRSLTRSVPSASRVEVVPVLIVWGPGCPALEGGHALLDGVEMFSGRHEEQWRHWLDEQRLDKDVVRELGSAMAAFDAAHSPTGGGQCFGR